MRDRTRVISVFLVAVACLAVGSLIGGLWGSDQVTGTLFEKTATSNKAKETREPLQTKEIEPEPSTSEEKKGYPDFTSVIEKTNPGVVSISASSFVAGDHPRTPFDDDIFKFFFGPKGPRGKKKQKQKKRRKRSGGSGFIISENGYILTNNHVIENADEITVTLKNDKEYEADIVGTDPPSDVALLKIDPENSLPVLPLGDSKKLEVGEWVIAIGNPMTLENTVTVGVVSAKGRSNLRTDLTFENFIQTDAAINFGNSGGPLINTKGEVIGISTLISRQGQNIGFAIPVNMVKEVIPQLKNKGKVSRGYLGVMISPVDPELQEAFDLPSQNGALVQNVQEGLPGDKAGLKKGDVITKVDGETVKSSNHLIELISSKKPGESAELTVFRNGEKITLTAELAERSEYDEESSQRRKKEPKKDSSSEFMGIKISDITPRIRKSLGLSADTEGVAVVSVDQRTNAWEAGLRKGDVITELNKTPVASVEEFKDQTEDVEEGSVVLVYVIRDNFSGYMSFRAESLD